MKPMSLLLWESNSEKSNHSLWFLYVYLDAQILYCKIQYARVTKLLQISASILHIWGILHFIGEL